MHQWHPQHNVCLFQTNQYTSELFEHPQNIVCLFPNQNHSPMSLLIHNILYAYFQTIHTPNTNYDSLSQYLTTQYFWVIM